MKKADCETKKTQNIPVASANSPCSGKYGPTLHVKVLDACNADCGFCIEHEGRTADNAVPANVLVERINTNPGTNIMLVGGEPTMHPGIGDIVRGVDSKKSVYMTTNGIKLNSEFVRVHSLHILAGLNISIHHWTEQGNGAIFRSRNYPRFQVLKEAIAEVRKLNPTCSIRVNANLTRGGIDNAGAVVDMIELARWLDASLIRFSEIQGEDVDNVFVNADEVFGGMNLPEDPFTGGCEQTRDVHGFPVMFRLACGYATHHRAWPGGKQVSPHSDVLYRDGLVTRGWATKNVEEVMCSGAIPGGHCNEEPKKGKPNSKPTRKTSPVKKPTKKTPRAGCGGGGSCGGMGDYVTFTLKPRPKTIPIKRKPAKTIPVKPKKKKALSLVTTVACSTSTRGCSEAQPDPDPAPGCGSRTSGCSTYTEPKHRKGGC